MTNLSDFDIYVFQEEDGSYYAEVRNLPGCFTMGESIEDLERNLKEAIVSYLTSLQKDLKGFHFDIQSKDIFHA